MRRPLLAVTVLAVLLLFVSTAGAHCIKRHSVPIATGTSPNGLSWSVDGSIGNNGDNCREWLFGMEFELQGVGGWGSSTGIPAGSHLGRDANRPSAFDELLEDGSYRVLSGFVNGEVAKVLVTLSNNKRLTLRPQSPPEQLREKVVWLRNVRYFVRFYPPEGFATGIATFNSSGQLLYRDKSWEGF